MYSDGFPDQFGGLKEKKYMNKRFKQFLEKNRKLAPEQLQSDVENELVNWQGKNEQIDDVLVMGILF